MGQKYGQLDLEERCEIARLHAAGTSNAKIAAALGRSPSTISRELKRNSGRDTGYRPAHAQDKTAARRWNGSRLDRDPALRSQVLNCLRAGWSPEQVAGRLGREAGHGVISHETIYRFIYSQIRRTNDSKWCRYLPRAKARRGYRRKKETSGTKTFKDRVSIDKRPVSVAARRTPGHWEADLMAFSKYGQNILVAHERCSRFLRIAPQPTKRAASVANRLLAWLRPLPPALRRSVTFDNGTEFAQHHRLNAKLQTRTYFCDPHSPWQKGGVENAIGRLRRMLPRKTDLAILDKRAVAAAVNRYNRTPRKCLGWKTPAEAISAFKPLHFKCESTSRRSSG
jgi:transposase, IS30 family